tara:strand:+ start:441 stop:824 length:384 start_codon:yes stop_codon:yes gene_type:complete
MNIRDKIINHALNVSCKIYNANKKNILENNNRNSNTIKAKRMFIYYLYKYMEITHKGMNNYFRTINHASSIHHVNKFQFELQTYKEIKKDFDKFLIEMKKFNIYGGGFYEKRQEIKKLLEELKKVKQ